MAEGGIKAKGSFAEPLVGGAEHIVVGEAMAEGKAAGLLMGQAEMGDGKGLLLRRQPPRGRSLAGTRLWSLQKGAAGRCRASAAMAHPLAAIRERWKGFSPLRFRPGRLGGRRQSIGGVLFAGATGRSTGELGHGDGACAIGYLDRSAARLIPPPWLPDGATNLSAEDTNGVGSGNRDSDNSGASASALTTATGCKSREWCRVRASKAPAVSDRCISLRMAGGELEKGFQAGRRQVARPVAMATIDGDVVSSRTTQGWSSREPWSG
jgi:hypothetical protein